MRHDWQLWLGKSQSIKIAIIDACGMTDNCDLVSLKALK
jgi:hypothetical protein